MNPDQLERNKVILAKYIPADAVELVAQWIYRYDFKLRIRRARASKYGDYRPPHEGKNHHITVNHDLNHYAFLLTLVHEVAHLTCHNKHGEKAAPHGREWKHEFRILMQPFIALHVFPPDVKEAVSLYLRDPSATSCADPHLQRVLRRYDKNKDSVLLETLGAGGAFLYREERYCKGEKRRKRFLCTHIDSGKKYLFSPVAEVIIVQDIP